jgi:hypothetical protein
MSARKSVAERLVEFFRVNPQEELSVADVAAKFGCCYRTAENAIFFARAQLGLERVSVYRIEQLATPVVQGSLIAEEA